MLEACYAIKVLEPKAKKWQIYYVNPIYHVWYGGV